MRSAVARLAVPCFLVAGTIASAGASLHCGKACTLVGCESGAEVEVHVQRPIADLADASIRLCRGTTCIEKPSSVRPERVGRDRWSFFTPEPRRSGFVVEREVRGWSTIRVRWSVDSRELADGDRYSGEIRDRDGVLVFTFDQAMVYRHSIINCGEDCRSGTMVVRQEPGPPVPCTNETCVSGAQFDFVVPMSVSALRRGGLEACLRTTCATSIPQDGDTDGTIAFEGELAGVTLDVEAESAMSTRATLTVVETPSLLFDGDEYTLSIVLEPNGERALLFQSTVEAYAERWPNGEACDLMPCRTAGAWADGGP